MVKPHYKAMSLSYSLSLTGDFFQSWNAVDDFKENASRQVMIIPKEDLADSFEKWKKCQDK